jgi:endogenous inhibitor of DNA gyrase (YacG/DUF329 family)
MRCPICKHELNEEQMHSSFFPFCSERCKLIDLGRWLTGKYQIPVAPDDEGDASPPRRSDPADDE